MPTELPLDGLLVLGGLLAGLMVGLTGMGGAAVVTPMLIFIFGLSPSVAVSTDLAAMAVIKPIGAGVHVVRRTPHLRIALWLCFGSVPGVLLGTLWFRVVATGADGSHVLRVLIGAVLLTSVAMSLGRLRLRRYADANANRRIYLSPKRRAAVALMGAVIGILVGLTSVGSGSLIAAALVLLFPSMRPSRLVGTDLVQAVPMLLIGALAHWGFGDIDSVALASLIVGQMPGIWIGARVSSHYDGQALRLLVLVFIGVAGLSLVGLPLWAVSATTIAATGAAAIVMSFRGVRNRNARRVDTSGAESSNGDPQPSQPPA